MSLGRIVMLGTDPAAPGGISSVLREYEAAGLMARWPVEMIPTWRQAGTWDRLRCAATAAARLWPRLLSDEGPHRGEDGHVQDGQPGERWAVQAVHAHVAARGSFWRKWTLLQPVHWAGRPVLMHVHDGGFVAWWSAQSPPVRRLVQRELERATRVLVLDATARVGLRAVAPRARFVVLSNPVDLGAPPPEPVAGRVLFLSRLRADKGLDDLLEAAGRLSMPFELVCAGDGDLEELHRKARTLGLHGRVHTPGWLSGTAKREALRRAQLMVLPSHAEGQPMAVLEAMAAGVPVLASDVGGLPALLRDGRGRLVARGDVAALSRALQELLADPDACRRLGQAGRDWVRRHHGRERVVARLERLYGSLGLRPRGARPLPPDGGAD